MGDLRSPEGIDIRVAEVKPGDIFLAVSDGVSDNITPAGLPVAVREEYHSSFDPSVNKADIKKFAKGVAQRAQNVMGTGASHAKKDDTCVAVLKVPRL